MAIQAGTYKLGPDNALSEWRPAAAVLRPRQATTSSSRSSRGRRRSTSATRRAFSSPPTRRRCTSSRARAACRRSATTTRPTSARRSTRTSSRRRTISFSSSERRGERRRPGGRGDLTMGGKTKPVDVRPHRERRHARRGSATVKQSDWGIKPYSALFGALKVNDEVKVVVDGKVAERPERGHYGWTGALIVGHIAGIPLEETLAMAVPVLGATYVAIMATLRSHAPASATDRYPPPTTPALSRPSAAVHAAGGRATAAVQSRYVVCASSEPSSSQARPAARCAPRVCVERDLLDPLAPTVVAGTIQRLRRHASMPPAR